MVNTCATGHLSWTSGRLEHVEAWTAAVVALLIALILGFSSVVLALILVKGWQNRPRHSGSEDDLEAKAERLHQAVHPEDDGTTGDTVARR